jgi:hypothetical protein
MAQVANVGDLQQKTLLDRFVAQCLRLKYPQHHGLS